MSTVVLGQYEQDFRVGTHPQLGDLMMHVSGDLPAEQIAILLVRMTYLEARVLELEAARFSARWLRSVRWVQRHWLRLVERVQHMVTRV